MFLAQYAETWPETLRLADDDSPVVTLSSPTLMPPPQPPPVALYSDPPSLAPVLVPQLGDTATVDIPPGISLDALNLLRQHGVASDSDWLWRAGAYALDDLARMLGESAPTTAAADLLRQYGVEGDPDWTWRATQYGLQDLGRILADMNPSGFATAMGGGTPTPSVMSAQPTFSPTPTISGPEIRASSWLTQAMLAPPVPKAGRAVSLPMLLAIGGLLLLFG